MGRLIELCATIAFIAFLVFMTNAQGSEKPVSFMPENLLHLEDGIFESNVSEAQFNHIIDLGESYYKPIAKKLGYNLIIKANWNDSTVNAYARQVGKDMEVHMFGGLARRPEVTEEGFALVLCHELGHHLAGFPTYSDIDGKWAATEGNSDFYATAACAKKILWGTAVPEPDKDIEVYCSKAKDPYQCYSGFLGAISLSRLLGSLNGEKASIISRDPKVVRKTIESYPSVQCRLDTYIAGILCETKWNNSLIPKTRDEMRSSSCDTRPRCWYSPK